MRVARVLAGVLLLASGAAAQPRAPDPKGPKPPVGPPAAPASDDAKKEQARVHFDRGMVFFEKQAWDSALAELLESRSFFPTRGNTQNAAVCMRNLGRNDEALDLFLALKQGFSLGEKDLALVDKEIQSLSAILGTIDVRVAEANATVTVDGRERGTSPISVRAGTGTHDVRVFKTGFLPLEKRVTVTGGGTTRVEGALQPLEQAGRLTITEEAGRSADVVIDNVVVGKTPWQGAFALGEHAVFLRGTGKLGTQPAQAVVRINQVTTLTLALEPLEARMRVEPTPAGVTVAVDGVVVGNGAWDGRLRAGRHKVELGAPGFLPQTREVSLVADQSVRIPVALERDPESPLWTAKTPHRVFVDVSGGLPMGLGWGGDVLDRCGGGCSTAFPYGVLGTLSVGYGLRSGLGFALDVGYTYLRAGATGRASVLRPVGKGENPGQVADTLSLRGLLVGVGVIYRTGEKIPLTGRLGAGALIGAGSDLREGSFTAGTQGYTVAPMRETGQATYLAVSPEIRVGYKVMERLEVHAGLTGWLLVALTQPSWENRAPVVAGTQGLATYDTETMVGRTFFGVSPGLGVRYDF